MRHDPALMAGAPASVAARLRSDGYAVVRAAMPRTALDALDGELAPRFARTPFSDGLFSGDRSKRFHGLLKRARGSADLVMHEAICSVAESILLPFADTVQLNLTQAIELHPGAAAQIPHRDHEIWQGEKGRIEYQLNVMWPLTPFTRDNGGTMVWPGSHKRQDARRLPDGEAIVPELDPGDALLFLGSTLHAGGANRTGANRRGIIVSYCLGWLKPYENMWLTYPPDVARAFPHELRALIGYRRNRPNLGSYDGRCPSILFSDDCSDYLGLVDDLTPEQQQALAGHSSAPRGLEAGT
jgi:ectoine hydroxylase-related dioxygenase (phytanoyl-CoA dioxygenase family)